MQNFKIEERRAAIEEIIAGNAFMAELQSRIVPLIVPFDVFWTRYFYQCAFFSILLFWLLLLPVLFQTYGRLPKCHFCFLL